MWSGVRQTMKNLHRWNCYLYPREIIFRWQAPLRAFASKCNSIKALELTFFSLFHSENNKRSRGVRATSDVAQFEKGTISYKCDAINSVIKFWNNTCNYCRWSPCPSEYTFLRECSFLFNEAEKCRCLKELEDCTRRGAIKVNTSWSEDLKIVAAI